MMPGGVPQQPGFRGGGGIGGDLVGPNSAIFQGGGIGGGPMPPSHGGQLGPMGPAGMFYQPEGANDLHPDLPENHDPLRIGPVRRPNPNGMFGPNGMGPGGFGPGGFGPGGFGPGGFGPGPRGGPGGGLGGGLGGSGGNMFI